MNKQEKIEEYLKKPYEVGDTVTVRGLGKQDKVNWGNSTEIISITEEGVFIQEYSRPNLELFKDIKKYTGHIGENPFPPRRTNLTTFRTMLHSVVMRTSKRLTSSKGYPVGDFVVPEINDNPYVFLADGTKEYYQRPYCWTLEQKQLLIDSIYMDCGCGQIIVRQRDLYEVERLVKAGHLDICMTDIVDGKQRINAVEGFMLNEFQDSNGLYYKDLSDLAQGRFRSFMGFSFGELGSNTTDKETLEQFLKTNHAGQPQSKEHIEFVKNLYKKS